MSNQDHLKPRGPGFVTLDRHESHSAFQSLVDEARADLRARNQEIAAEFFGQEAGVPGQGSPPQLWHEPGGSVIAQKFLHPGFKIFEREFRTLPEDGFYSPSVSARRPVEFEMGAYKVPPGMVLWLTDYEFQVYRPSGLDAGDFVVAAAGRFSNQIGFDINVSAGIRNADISYQLDPQPNGIQRSQFQPTVDTSPDFRAPDDRFRNSAARSFASTASPGTSLLPRRTNVQGPRDSPFTWVVGEGASVALVAVVFNPLTSPVSAISGRMAGYLLHTNLSQSLIQRVRPR